MTDARMPISTASRRGVSMLVAEAEEHRVILTSHGRPVAVVDSAARLDEDLRRIREASRAVAEAAGDLALGRSRRINLDELCARLDVDPEQVRQQAASKRA